MIENRDGKDSGIGDDEKAFHQRLFLSEKHTTFSDKNSFTFY